MISRTVLVAAAAIVVATSMQARAADDEQVPPDNAKKLSEIVSTIEKRDHFRYIRDIEWDSGGTYDVTYYTTDKAKVEMKINAVSGEPVSP